VSERSFAMGIMNAGTAVGAVIAPPFIAVVLSVATWRWIFFLAGAAGLVWSLWWWRDYRTPASSADSAIAAEASWLDLFTFPEVWGIVGAKFLSDAAWYFYLFWVPKYLYDARGFDVKKVGYFAWIPYAAAGVGCLVGGWFSGWLIRRGYSLNWSRKLALGLSAAVMPSVALVNYVPVELAIALLSLVFFGQQSWSTLVMVLPADLFPRGIVGSVAGLVGFGGAMGGVVFGLIAGRLLDHGFGYSTLFAIVSTLHVIAFLLILSTVRAARFSKSSSQ
jgi:MFS transporter, ACS family, hexuronate transporter